MAWFRAYYRSVFPAGSHTAKEHYKAACRALLQHPLIGHKLDFVPEVREFIVSRTPFSFIYVVEGDEILVLRLLDNRAERPETITS